MEEDWGSMAKAPTFTLFKKVSPVDEAKKDSFVDIIVYNGWTKAERRLYQRLKAEYIAKQIEEEKLKSIDDIVNSLGLLELMKETGEHQETEHLDDLITKLQCMKVNNTKGLK